MIKQFKKEQWYKYTGKRNLCSYNPTGDNNLVKCETVHRTMSASFFDEQWMCDNPLITFKRKELKDFTKVNIPVIAELRFKVISKKDFAKDNKILVEFCTEYQHLLLHIKSNNKFTRIICKLQCEVGKDPIDLLKEKLKHSGRVTIFKNVTRGFYFAEFIISR